MAAGPWVRAPSALKVDPWAGHKNDDFELLYSTVDPACGQTDEKALKLETTLFVKVRITITPLLAIKSFTDFNSVAKFTVKTFVLGFEPVFTLPDGVGAFIDSFEHAKAKQATQVDASPPDNVDRKSFLFMFCILTITQTTKISNCFALLKYINNLVVCVYHLKLGFSFFEFWFRRFLAYFEISYITY